MARSRPAPPSLRPRSADALCGARAPARACGGLGWDVCSTKRTEPTARASLAERDIERNGTMTSTFSCMQPKYGEFTEKNVSGKRVTRPTYTGHHAVGLRAVSDCNRTLVAYELWVPLGQKMGARRVSGGRPARAPVAFVLGF
ncbi:hypothetical protein EVAR_2454_1 [Eumeta japonica]|uniref:Uncharacterized protein n=1 Tax=Eumeta variegata TaxID=151549 RepID=A0A4C1SP19_EUMVA|nr:hypothetical protein EVAR_2454_1 [Eumeta japonica]